MNGSIRPDASLDFLLVVLTLIKCVLRLPPSILDLFLDLDWIFENLPVKSLGSNMSTGREAMRSRTIPSWPWLCVSRSWCWAWASEGPLPPGEALLSAHRPVVFLTSSWEEDMTPAGTCSSQPFSSSNVLLCFHFPGLLGHMVVSPSSLRGLGECRV